MAGLGAARTLVGGGHEVVVFEKSRGLGGRVSTRRVGDYVFDHGATILSPGGSELGRVMREDLDAGDLVRVEKPIFVHALGRVTPVDPEQRAPERFAYRSGNNMLGKLLGRMGEGCLDVRLETRVEGIEREGGVFRVGGEDFEALVLTPPIPQTAVLLGSMGEERGFEGSRYRTCVTVLLGFSVAADTPYHALIDPDQSEPLTWMSVETAKVPGGYRAPEGHTAVVAQMSARYSMYSIDKSDEELVKGALADVSRILGPGFRDPVVSNVMRWRYSHVSNVLSYENVNARGSRVLVASDGLLGPRAHQAYEVGVRAARQLMEDFA